MSDDLNNDGDLYIDPEDIVQVIDLEDIPANGNGIHGEEGEDEAEAGYGDDNEDDSMETGGATAAPTQDDSTVTFSGHQNDAVICCDIHPQTSEIAVTGGQDDKAAVWNTKTGALLFECTGHTDTVNAVEFSADGTMVATADMKGLVQVWAVPSGALAWFFEVGDIEWLQWHQLAPVLLAGTKDGQVWMWKIPSGDCKTFSAHGSGVSCGKLLPDGKHCCVGYDDGVVKIWDLKASEAAHTVAGYEGHTSSVLCMDVKAGVNFAMTGSADMTAKIINTTNGKVLSTYQCGRSGGQGDQEGEEDSVEAVGLCPLNDFAATGTLSGSLEVWDLPTKSVRQRYEHPYGLVKLLWSPSTPVFYTACLDACVRQFDARSGQMVNLWQGHTAAILDLSLAKDESLMLTASDDFTAKVFSLGSNSQPAMTST